MQVIRKSDNREFKISPLVIEPKIHERQEKTSDDELSQIDSPCFKREYSMASTLDSPLSICSRNDED
jgi:hypothetical protein